jgi:hypothetical protein
MNATSGIGRDLRIAEFLLEPDRELQCGIQTALAHDHDRERAGNRAPGKLTTGNPVRRAAKRSNAPTRAPDAALPEKGAETPGGLRAAHRIAK